jgi:hypothetical protein
VGSRRKLRFRSDLQLFHDALTLRCNETGAAAKLSGDLFVCFALSEPPQQLLLLRRQLVAVRRWYLPLQVGPRSALTEPMDKLLASPLRINAAR